MFIRLKPCNFRVLNDLSLKQVKQALPLPQHVEDEAIGFFLNINGFTPLPKDPIHYGKLALVMIGIILIFLGFYFWKRRVWFFLRISIQVLLAGQLSSCSQELVNQNQAFNEVTFILGEDKTPKNPYYQNAKAYFSTNEEESTPLIISECKSLLELKNWLEKNKPNSGPWKQINLVVHGNQWTGMNVPVGPSGERCSSRALKAMMNSRQWKPLDEKLINSKTHIAIIGCNLGKDQQLLETIAAAFGGKDAERPSVSSAPYFNIFEHHVDSLSRHLADAYFVSFPAGSFPGNKYLLEQFQKKYPQVVLNWKSALQTLEPQEDRAPYVHYFFIPASWGVAYKQESDFPILKNSQDTLTWISKLEDLQLELERMEIPMEDFKWKIKAEKVQGYPTLIAKGHTIIYCILKPIVDEQNQYIKAKFNNPQYNTIVP